jgi:hypothetical protein
MRGALLLSLLLIFLLFFHSHVFASFISIDTNVSASVNKDIITVDCKVANKGDEPAHKVEIEADFTEKKFISPLENILPAGSSINRQFKFSPKAAFSRIVIPLTIRYKDANQYAFSAISYTDIKSSTDELSTIICKIEDSSISKKGKLVLKIKSLDQNTHSLSLRIVAPAELTVLPLQKTVSVPKDNQINEMFEIENFSAIAPSSYTILAIVSEKRDSGSYDEAFIGKVSVTPEKQWFDFLSKPYLIWALIVIFVLYAAYQIFHRRINKAK